MSRKITVELTPGQLRALNSACAFYSAEVEVGQSLASGPEIAAFLRAWQLVQNAMIKRGVKA